VSYNININVDDQKLPFVKQWIQRNARMMMRIQR